MNVQQCAWLDIVQSALGLVHSKFPTQLLSPWNIGPALLRQLQVLIAYLNIGMKQLLLLFRRYTHTVMVPPAVAPKAGTAPSC